MSFGGVSVYTSQIEEKLLTIPTLSPHYQIVLTKEANGDRLEIQVEARPEAYSSHVGREKAASALRQLVQETIGLHAAVTILDPGAIERSQGKAKRIVRR